MKIKCAFLPIVIFCVCIFSKIDAQTTTSSIVILRGYVVKQYSKKEIVNSLTSSNKNFIPFDFYERTFFIPLRDSSLEVMTDSLNFLHRNFIVFLPSKETNNLINEFCRDKGNLTENKFPSYKLDSNYFEVKGKANDRFLFQYFYIECKAIKVSVPNNSKNAFLLNTLYDKSIAKNYPNLDCIFAFDTIILEPIQSINSKKIQPFEINQKISPHE